MGFQYVRLHLLVLAGLLFAAGYPGLADEQSTETGKLVFPAERLTLPFTEAGVHPKVAVSFGDGRRYEFIVDTGASVNVLDSAIAESLALEIVGETHIGAPGGAQIPGNIVRAPRTSIGDATVAGAEFVTMDLAAFSGGATQGVLGVGLFRQYLLTFDYVNNEIRVSRETLSRDDPGVVVYNDVHGHIQIDVDVAGTSLATHIDTGSMAGFTLPVELMTSLPTKPAVQGVAKARMVGGDRDIQRGQLDGDIVLAGFRFADPYVGFMDPSPGYGNVGSRLLNDFVVSVDQKNHLIRFQKPTVTAGAMPRNAPRRLGVQFRGMPGGTPLRIGYIEPGSLGDKAGLRPGDLLVKLNGKPGEEYNISTLGALFRGDELLHLEVERDGELLSLEIQ